jgi:hypothetical protein
MTRVIGPPKSRRRRWTFLWCLTVALAAGIIFIPGALAVHDYTDGMQLDGDVSHACPPSPDTGLCKSTQKDWADLFTVTDNTSTPPGTEAVAPDSSVVGATGSPFTNASFTRDFQTGGTSGSTTNCSLSSLSTSFCTGDDTTFATGSKDTLNIGGWQCNHDNNVNSKIDIMNAYAAAYTAANGDQIMYFGLEKNKDNGTNDVGFWFLQGNADCSSTGSAVTFTGTHTVGDVLVVSEFTSGGGVSNITAYEWVGGKNPLTQIATATGLGGDCKTATGADNICATTNSGAHQFNTKLATPWLTADATLGVGKNQIVPPDFFEGGINLTQAFNSGGTGSAPSCFNTFIGDTRSSTSLTATLFDFTRGQIGHCESGLSTQQNAVVAPATSISIGTGTVSSGTDTATLSVTGSSTWGGTLTWYLCGPITSPTLCDNHGVSVTSRTVSNSSPASDFVSGTATLTSAGRYCWHAHFEPNDASKTAGIVAADDDGTNECFTVAPVAPTLTTSATCTSSPCVLGTDTLSDKAFLSGTATQPGDNGPGGDTGLYKSINATQTGAGPGLANAGGTISWTLYGPTNGGCTDTKSTSPATAAVSGDNTNPGYGPTSYKPLLADGVGTYTFVATYNGSSPNTSPPSTTATCASPGTNETVTIIGSASSSSAQRWLPNDRVVLTTSAGTLNGTLTVTLYSGTFTGTAANCTKGTATAVTGQSYTFTPSGAASGTAYNTTNSTFFVGTKSDGTAGGAAGNYFWLVHYDDSNLTDPPDRCESSNLTITDS